MKAKRKVKGGVVRHTRVLEGYAKAYLEALDRLTSFKARLSDQLSQLSELQEAFDAAELDCTMESAKHLVTTTSVTVAGVKFSRSSRTTRVVDPAKMLGSFPELRKVEGLVKVALGPFDKVIASGAYDVDRLGATVTSQTSFRYHTQKE